MELDEPGGKVVTIRIQRVGTTNTVATLPEEGPERG